MKILKMLLSCVLIIFVANSFAQSISYSVQNLTVWDFKQQLLVEENYVIIDVRVEKYYKKNRIKNALSAENSESLFAITDSLDHEQAIFLYSHDGLRSETAAEILLEKGFSKIYNLQGGIEAWIEAGYEIDKKKRRVSN